MKFRAVLLLLELFTSTALWVVPAWRAATVGCPDLTRDEEPDFQGQIAPLLRQYCVSCHGGAKPKAGLALDQLLQGEASLPKDTKLLATAARVLRAGEMPPEGKPRPSSAE